MRKLLLLCLLFPVIAFPQGLSLTLSGGVTNYQGDLQAKYFTLGQSNLAFGAGLKYDLTPHWAVRTGFMLGKISASDAKNDPQLRFRNLSFESKITEGNLLLEYTLFDMQDKKISPYVFAGLAVFHFDPYAFDSLDNKVFLKPLSTEGEGLPEYPNRKPYKLTQFSIPIGGGVKFRVSDNVVLSYEIGLRKTFTDYLDDVSTTYVDEFILAQERGLKSVEMAYRAGELKGGNTTYPADGTTRGGSKYKDWYYFTGFTLYIGLNTGSSHFLGGKRSSTDCPTRVN